MTKEDILAEIRRTTEENGGTPLGRARFEHVTGIGPYDWGKFWARFGEAVREAGFEPNVLNAAYGDEHLIQKFIDLTRELNRVPTRAELRVKRARDPDFPSPNTFDRFGGKAGLLRRVLEYSRGRDGCEDVIELCQAAEGQSVSFKSSAANERSDAQTKYGFVYLVRGHPGEYKIGRTNLVDRRLSELGATAAVEHTLVHEIKTDDPPGVEGYWHARFKERRMRGEWFRLTATDVKAFKRWRRIF